MRWRFHVEIGRRGLRWRARRSFFRPSFVRRFCADSVYSPRVFIVSDSFVPLASRPAAHVLCLVGPVD